MTFVDPTASGAGAGAPAGATAAASSRANTGLNQLDNSQTFLNLLVAQLKNQNPDNPTDPTSFMTEIAQLTAVQSQTTLNADEETVAADSMLGRQIAGNGSGGKVNGVVSGVLLGTSGEPVLELAGGGSLNLSAVQAVYGAAPSTSSDPSTSTTTSTSPSTSTPTTPVA